MLRKFNAWHGKERHDMASEGKALHGMESKGTT
jgi:hypothetical protein